MGSDLRLSCLVETRRLLVLMGVIFGLILFVQYFELPYSRIFSSLLSTGKSQLPLVDGFGNSSTDPTTSSNGGNEKNIFDPEDIKNLDDNLNNDLDPEDDDSVPLEENREKSEYTSNTGALVGKNEASNPETLSATKSPLNLTSQIPSTENPDTVLSSRKGDGLGEGPPAVVLSDPKSYSNLTSQLTPGEMEDFREEHPGEVTMSKMNDMLLHSRVSYKAVKARWSSAGDQELLKAKSLIENASDLEMDTQFDVNLYRNLSEFKRSYGLMEQTLKVYIYAEGEKPIFHQPPLKGIYASEGWFMKLLKSNKKFVTKSPKKAHLFYLPFSSRMLEVALYVPDSHSRDSLIERLSDYVQMITKKYTFWNRTNGADHFLVACHDWAPAETRHTMPNCIRALCNSDIKEGFKFGKDVSLPETFVRSPQHPLRQLGGKPPFQRRTLAFFAGSMHGYLRPVLLRHWENKDPDMKIFGQLRKKKGEMSYAQYMKSSKYCICARGFEVNSPRVVEAIFYECVPVIISDGFVPPFFETLNWESFAVFVLEKDIPNLKSILLSISERRYVRMQKRVKEVQRHFLWHPKPVKYDVFHMILHSVWYNRVLHMVQ